MLSQAIEQFVQQHTDETVALLKTLAQIPAPSGKEHARAVFCRDWLHAKGVSGAFIDSAENVICVFGDPTKSLAVVCAHSDVVFPDTEPLPLCEENGRLYCPGVGDDTANVVALMMAAWFLSTHKKAPQNGGLLLVIDSCEEGLGNLKGIRRVMQEYGDRVRECLSFDCSAREIITQAVGSRRYCIAVDTVGGHSYFDFPAPNAVALLSSVVGELYKMQVPKGTTYNVGVISGGTSVNTIAQHAEMLFECRSDNAAQLDAVQQALDKILASIVDDTVCVTCRLLGERPCAVHVDETRQQELINRASARIKECFGIVPVCKAGSTDCNIPLSLGIPSICFGCLLGDGMHTRQEYVELDSIPRGLRLALKAVCAYL